jgi:signal peptidase I
MCDASAVRAALRDAVRRLGVTRGQRRRAEPARPARGRRRRLKPVRLWREIPILICVALVLALGIKTFLVQAFFIPSPSMENTLRPGDKVLVDKLSPWFGAQPQRGQVVVFRDPGGWLDDTDAPVSGDALVRGIKDAFTFVGLLPSQDQHDLIKRVIAVGGDQVECCDAQGRITVDGTPLSESQYLYPGSAPSLIRFDVKVPAGRIWVMGDNRGDSADSRYHMDNGYEGTVPVSDVVGHAFVLIWPPSRAGALGVPATFHQEGLAALRTGPAGTDGAALVGAVPIRLAWRMRRAPRRRRRGIRREDTRFPKWLWINRTRATSTRSQAP